MRATPLALAIGALLAATGCYGGSGSDALPEDVIPTGEPETEHVYAPGQQITADLTMLSGSDGGRATPFFSGYRATVRFDHEDQTAECTAQLPVELREFPPGENHVIGLECDTEVTVPVDAPGFTLLDGDQEHGSGEVLFTGEGR
ncbi:MULTISPECIES: hypothetical protein [unclassified Nocardiopsis]|uniref:hypothetical protein n=1 Tax=unclassified Nocardiopsis TaxID=2649073 RepID=UPI001357687C|nr:MULTISPECIES: hypothetical protein [unclassified Nocardiopsis]